MGEFEAYAQSVTCGLDLSEATKARIAEEVVAHLEDDARRCLAEGMSQGEARRAAVERFGKEQVIGQLIAGALERKQQRFRQLCATRTTVVTAVLVIVSIAVGAWFTVFDDAVSGRAFMQQMPRIIGPLLYVGGAVGCLGVLAVVVGPLFRVRWLAAFSSCIAMMLIFFASVYLFDAIPALRETIGRSHPGQSGRTMALNALCMRLYLCWTPTVMTGIVVAAVGRRRGRILALAASLAIGLLSAALWGLNYLPSEARWMYAMKWPKLLSTGLLALVFVILTGVLARTIAERFGPDRNRPGYLWRDAPSTSDDPVTPVQIS